jgi:alpha/beta superfamily hydrolase
VTERVLVPGTRDVRATLDVPLEGGANDAGAPTSTTEACIVACPPHPQLGGSRTDARLRAVSDALVKRDVACLRFDYGEWDEGNGERRDARNAVSWASDRYAQVGLFGYSFGASVALLAAAGRSTVAVVSALAPGAQVADFDVVGALDAIDCPVQAVHGERDETVDWAPVVERARELGFQTESLPADHHFVGQHDRVAATVARFLTGALLR